MTTKTIGLTGGIGSGKSFIASIFSLMGIPIYDSDSQAKLLMIQNEKVKNAIIELLGKKAYEKTGELNRQFIAEKIFNDPAKLKKMNKIVHPAVRKDFERFSSENQRHPYIINEAALFVENGSYKQFNHLITVLSPQELRIKRAIRRDDSTREEIMKRIDKQSSDQEKAEVSDFIIYNDYVVNLFQQISAIHRALIK